LRASDELPEAAGAMEAGNAAFLANARFRARWRGLRESEAGIRGAVTRAALLEREDALAIFGA
jgi:hypothetical protein